MKEFLKGIGNGALVILCIISVVLTGVFGYYKTLGKDKVPAAVTATYVTEITDPQTGEKMPAIEANYFANYNGSGLEVIELRFNVYSGVSKQAVYSRGFQLINYSGVWKLYQYNSYDGISFITGHDYKWGDKMIVDIDGTTYAVALDGQYQITTSYFSFLKAVGHTFAGLFTGYNYKEKAYTTETKIYNYTFEDLLQKVKQIIKSSSNGTGSSVIPLIDLGDFLHIYEIDDKGQISGEPLGVNTLINSYFTMSTGYDNRGVVWAKQSLFNSVGGDSGYNTTGIDDTVEYWKDTTRLVLTEKDFVARYVSAESGNYYSLSTETIKSIKNFKNLEIYINFNISKIDANVLGFDYYALYGLDIKDLTITSSGPRTFKLLISSLKETGITEINTTNVTIINNNSGVTL